MWLSLVAGFLSCWWSDLTAERGPDEQASKSCSCRVVSTWKGYRRFVLVLFCLVLSQGKDGKCGGLFTFHGLEIGVEYYALY